MSNAVERVIDAAKGAFNIGPKVRYGIVALGDISQRAFMPGVQHTGNSEITALVSGDISKAKEVAKLYQIKEENVYHYDQFDKFIKDGVADAIYLATPNFRHLEFVEPALKAGIHVLLEKPAEVTVEKCQKIMELQKASTAKVMIAYRLHFEPATVEAVMKCRNGDLGEVLGFSSVFTQPLDPENHRAKNSTEAGPVFDMGTYPVNAVRNLYGEEPTEVFAYGVQHPQAGFSTSFDDTVTAILRFPSGKVAQFTVSYYGNAINEYTVYGTKGSVRLDPGFLYGCGLAFDPLVNKSDKKKQTFKETDQFGGQCKYFSNCILNNLEVEPDPEEGLCDIRVLEAVVRSTKTGQPQKLEPYTRKHSIQKDQVYELNPPTIPKEIGAKPPSKE